MKKKQMIIVLLLVFALVVITIGVTYAVFRGSITGATTQTITVNNITFQYIERNGKGHGISIGDALPVSSNNTAKSSNDYFEFDITASVNGTAITPYIVTAKMNEGSSGLLASSIDLYLTEVNGNSENATSLFRGTLPKYTELEQYEKAVGYTEKVIYTGTATTSNYNKKFRLRMWIDQDTNLAGISSSKYYCGETEVVSGTICSNGRVATTSHASNTNLNDQTFSVTVNVYAEGQLSTLANLVLSDNEVIKTSPVLTTRTSESNENGLYKMSVTNGFGGANGDTYYFRGNVTNNVVDFANLTWRIVRINEDGTVRLILDGYVPVGSKFYNNGAATYEYMYYSNTTAEGDSEYPNAKYLADKWYKENITDLGYGNKVATGNYFCEAAKVAENSEFKSQSGTTFMELRREYTPDLKCLEDGNHHQYVPGSVGLLTYDEVVLAGAIPYTDENGSYYLRKNANNEPLDYTWWTMSPGGILGNNLSGNGEYVDGYYIYDWAVYSTWDLNAFIVHAGEAIRPVINIKSDVIATKNQSTGHYVIQ